MPPERILCVTFTNRAARELRAAILARFPGVGPQLAPRTFHQLCADILRREAKRVGLMVDFSVCPDHDSVAMLKRILSCPEDDDRKPSRSTSGSRRPRPTGRPPSCAGRSGPPGRGPASTTSGCATPPRSTSAASSQWQLVDFADLVLYVRALFAARPRCCEHWASRYDLVQVDEIQDTHLSEYEVVATLARQSGNLALFGDLDQTIYEWRGAMPGPGHGRFRADFGTFRDGPA